MLSGLNLQQRKEMFTRITDDTLAGILVVMVPAERQKLLNELKQTHPGSAERVMQYIRYIYGINDAAGHPLQGTSVPKGIAYLKYRFMDKLCLTCWLLSKPVKQTCETTTVLLPCTLPKTGT